jgi:hypothetical protein
MVKLKQEITAGEVTGTREVLLNLSQFGLRELSSNFLAGRTVVDMTLLNSVAHREALVICKRYKAASYRDVSSSRAFFWNCTDVN